MRAFEIRQTEIFSRWSESRHPSSKGAGKIMARVKVEKLKTRRWDAAEYLDSEKRIAKYLEAAFADGDPVLIAAAIGDVARARGMSQLADEIGVSRPALYRALSAEGNPEFATVAKVLRAFGLKLTAMPMEKAKGRKAAA